MKMKLLFVTFILLFTVASFSQDNVGIGTTTPNASAILDLSSTTKGLLPPRMTATQRNGISNPATGLIIYNTTDSRYEYNAGTPTVPAWTVLASWGSQNQNLVLASPDGSNGMPSFRALTNGDIPNLSAAKITSGNLGVAQGGTGVATISGMLKGNGASAFSGVTATAGELTYWSDNSTIAGASKLTYDATNSILTFDGSFKYNPLASAPVTPSKGMTYYNNSDNKLYLWNGSSWVDLTVSGGGGGSLPVGTESQTLRYDNTNTLVATSLLRVTSTNVGIGDSFTPNALLHTDAGNSTASYHKFTAGTTTDRTATDGFDIGIDGSGKGIIRNFENQPLLFATNDTTRMIVNGGNGGVQILSNVNYTNVNALNLHNTTAGGQSIAMNLTNTSSSKGGFRIGINGNGTAEIKQLERKPITISGDTAVSLSTANNKSVLSLLDNGKINVNSDTLVLMTKNSERMRIWDNGQIGINTSATFDDSLKVKIVGDLMVDGDLVVTGNMDPISLIFIPQETAPKDSPEGTMYYNATEKRINLYNGEGWSKIPTVSDASNNLLNVVTKNDTYSISPSDDVILCDASSSSFDVTLPSASGISGKVLYFVRVGAPNHEITIKAQSGQTIDGFGSKTLGDDEGKISMVSDGSNWYILGFCY